MKKKLFTILTIMLVTMLSTSTVFAAGGLKFRTLELSPTNSLVASGELTGVGSTDVTVVIVASGIAKIICTNNGGNDAPGQNTNITSIGDDVIPGNDPQIKNGRTPFNAVAHEPASVPWDVAGCPSANWTGKVDSVLWTNATVSVYNTATGVLLLQQAFVCDPALQTATTVSCKPVP